MSASKRCLGLVAVLWLVYYCIVVEGYVGKATSGRNVISMGLFSGFTAKKKLSKEFDYIIVGGGTAGCVLANRLSANENKKVLVLEAGSSQYKNKYIRIPAGIIRLFKSKFDWNFESSSEPGANGRDIYLCRGKVLGGSSSLNVQLYHRGAPDDYKHWVAASGSEEWSAERTLPYFKKSEDDYRGESRYHGTGGEFSVSQVRYQNPLSKAFLKSCEELNYPENKDFNDWAHSQEGYGRYDVNQKNGERSSAASGFLDPVKKRKNLTVVSQTYVRKVLFNEQKKAVGVEVEVDGEIHVVKLSSGSDGEVILSGGAINSPQLLLLSGIGPKEHLAEKGIPALVDAPGVGQNLQDHPAAVVSYDVNPKHKGISVTSKLRIPGTKINNPKVFLEWLFFKRGLLTSTGCDHGGFFSTKPGLTVPNLQLRFLAARALSADGMSTYSKFRDSELQPDGFSFQSIVARPFSTGSVQLKSSDPKDKPVIKTGYFTDERDLETMREGLRLSRKLAQQPAFADYIGTEVFPGGAIQSDEDLNQYIKNSVHTSNALVGTCRIGKAQDPLAVVSADLKVYGVTGLRVVDASVIPKIIGGQTSAPVVMIAEKAADFIQGKLSP